MEFLSGLGGPDKGAVDALAEVMIRHGNHDGLLFIKRLLTYRRSTSDTR